MSRSKVKDRLAAMGERYHRGELTKPEKKQSKPKLSSPKPSPAPVVQDDPRTMRYIR